MEKVKTIDQATLKSLLAYNPETGTFTWVGGRFKFRIGQAAGCDNGKGYILITVNQRMYKAHRLAFLYMTGHMPKAVVDHIDGNPSNNAWSNLRECTSAQNNRNVTLIRTNTTGVKNVDRCSGSSKFRVLLSVDGQRRNFGHYDELELAELVAIEAREKFHGEFANHGTHLGDL